MDIESTDCLNRGEAGGVSGQCTQNNTWDANLLLTSPGWDFVNTSAKLEADRTHDTVATSMATLYRQ